MAPDPIRVAVIDIGTNSTRLLVADVAGEAPTAKGQTAEDPAPDSGAEGRTTDRLVTEVDRQTNVTRLGRGVDLSGTLSSEAIEDVCSTIESYRARCEELGAGTTVAIATSAVRDASNGDAFLAELRERFGLEAQLLDGSREAHLTYLGATSSVSPSEPTLVIDIGGGSTELVIGTGSDVTFFTSLQAGVVRHTERHLVGDPPTTPQLEALAADIRQLVDVATTERSLTGAQQAIGVAGTPTSLAAIDLELEPYDPERVHGHQLSLDSIQRMMARLAGLPTSERAAIPGMHPARAPTIVAGVVILIETMRAFGLTELTVSEHDILYGAALDAARR